MHDPDTVAFDIRLPIGRTQGGYRPTLITIWHHDPERDGSDESCGYTFPRLTKWQRERLKGLAWSEAYEPWFRRLPAKRNESPDAEALMRGAIIMVARVLDIRVRWDEVCFWASEFIHNPLDNFRGGLCFLPGYHSNSDKDCKSDREDAAYGLFSGIARNILRERRPWWQHPRWHLWHWQIQIHPLQHFLRWAFTRCAKCGGRFHWGETGVGTWDGDGPRWFRPEHLTHMACDQAPSLAQAEAS